MRDDTKQLLYAYIAATLNKMPEDWGEVRQLSGMEVAAALWPLNDLLRPHLEEAGALPYEPRFETAADAVVEGYVVNGETALENLPNGVWRVLIERHMQALVVAAANEAAGNAAFMPVPATFPEASIPGVAAIYLLHGMKLPYPPKPRLANEFPARTSQAKQWLH